MKVRGGYDFPGSNSGTDLAVLTGWIPQQVFLHDEEIEQDQLWSELVSAFRVGNIILTIGTGKLPRGEQKQLGLAAEHDYAVLDLHDDGPVKEMLLKNPWADGDVWKGALRRRPNPTAVEDSEIAATVSQDNQTEDMMPGTFWIQLHHVFQYFDNLYINWNPCLFSHRQDMHFSWQTPLSGSARNIFITNPQFSVSCSKPGKVWILLNRHFRTGDYTHANHGKNGYISLYLYKRNGTRLLSSEGAEIRGPFVDSPNTLLKYEVLGNAPFTVVVASHDLPP